MKFFDRVKETSTTTGTGSIVLLGAVAEFQSFAGYSVGDEVPYEIKMGAEWEIGRGTKNANGFARTVVTSSSNAGQLVNFSAGTKEVFVNVSADFFNGQTLAQLSDGGAAQDTDLVEISRGGVSMRVTVAALRAAQATDTSKPTLVSAVVANGAPSNIVLTFSEALAAATPAAAAFAVSGGKTVTGVAVSGAVVTLTCSAPYANGDSITATYTKPGTNPLQDTAGNQVDTFGPNTVTNNVAAAGDTTNPTATSAAVANASPTIVAVTMSEALNAAFVPAASAFTVAGHTVSSVAISGSTINLTVTPAFANAEAARTVAYVKPGANDARDPAGNLLQNFSGLGITNNVAAAAGTAYTITGYGGTQAPPTTVNATSSGVYGSKKLAITKPGVYYNLTPMPASAVAGWGNSNSVPPATLNDPALNFNGASSINGMVAMSVYGGAANTMRDESSLWVDVGSGTTTWYLWIKPVDGAAYCFNPAGTVVSGA